MKKAAVRVECQLGAQILQPIWYMYAGIDVAGNGGAHTMMVVPFMWNGQVGYILPLYIRSFIQNKLYLIANGGVKIWQYG